MVGPEDRPDTSHDTPENRVANAGAREDHTHDILTLANIITVIRLIMVPVFFDVLLSGRSDFIAFLIFAIASGTDWVDGQIARRTGTVTELGKAIDPIVDRLLIASGVLGVYLLGRLPMWTVLLLLARDLYLLGGAAHLARNRVRAIPVIFLGKLTTAILLFAFSGLILNWPLLPGLGILDSAQLPGLGATPAALGIWFVYAGICTSLVTAVIYTMQARRALAQSRAAR